MSSVGLSVAAPIILLLSLSPRAAALSPFCEIEDPAYCQLMQPGDSTVTLSDMSGPGGAVLRADDFVPTGTTITTICIWGAYLDGNKADGQLGCSADVTDQFRVTVYSDAGGMPDDANIIGTRTILSADLSREEYPGTGYETEYFAHTGEPMFAYRMVLTTPITGMVPGNCYWLEVVNNTPAGPVDPPNACEWHWAQVRGNNYSFMGAIDGHTGSALYGVGGERASDLAFCLDCGIESGGCVAVERACCSCPDDIPPSACTVETLATCTDAEGVWDAGGTACTGYECPAGAPAGDTCANAIEITGGTYLFNTTCAEINGPSGPGAPWSVLDENGNLVGFGAEIWYKLILDENDPNFLQISTCRGGSGDDTYDGMMAVFHNPSYPTECACPGDAHFMQNGLGSNEGCNGISDRGQGYLERCATAGDCWMIAVGGFSGNAGPGALNVSRLWVDGPWPRTPLLEPAVPDNGYGTRIRYLAFQAEPESAGLASAIRVKLTDLPAPFEYAEARTMWVGEPADVSEVAGKPDATPPTFKLAGLQCDPFFTDWTSYSTVYVRSESFVPRGSYQMQAINEAGCCPLTSETCYSDPLPIKLSKWGDAVGDSSASSPQGVADFADISSVVDKFKNLPGAPTKSRADVAPSLPNAIVDFVDIPAVVDAFRGLPYPYAGPPVIDPCAK